MLKLMGNSKPKSPLANLFLIGAMKSATSLLWTHLGEHPEIYAPKIKEIKFFSRYPDWPKHVQRYLALFRQTKNQKYLLDGSPQYTFRPKIEGVAKRIYEFNPRARLIYIVRDPFERLISHYKYHVWTGRESRRLLEALRDYPSEYLTVSNYSYQLRPYFEAFNSDAIYVLSYESLVVDGRGACRKLFRWLEIDPDFVPASVDQRILGTPKVLRYFATDSLRVKLWLKAWHHRRLVRLVPRRIRNYARNLLPQVGELDVSSPKFIHECALAREMLAPYLKQWILEFETLLGKRFDEWPSTGLNAATATPTNHHGPNERHSLSPFWDSPK